MIGAYANPPDGACIAFKCANKDYIHEYVKRDPCILFWVLRPSFVDYQNGLITEYTIRDWCVVPLDK